MKSRPLSEGSERTFVIILESGEEAMRCLGRFAQEHRLSAARFSAIGAFEQAVLGFFDWAKRDYERIVLREQVEVASLLGDVALKDGKSMVHAHVVVTKRDGSAHGGHLLEGTVRPTLEVMLVETRPHLHRIHDPQSGLALISP